MKSLGTSAPEAYQLEVLRPPTFSQLTSQLHRANAAGKPYHVVHFDGHGTYRDLEATFTGQPAHELRGYIAFENPAFRGNEDLKNGAAIGALLAETNVSILVLNACRSAHAEGPAKPEIAGADPAMNKQMGAFGSLAQEVVDAGVAGVVAMRYNVYVVTAAQFVSDLYAMLASGQTLGEAVTIGRKRLKAAPEREITYAARALQDWMVPIVYEASPITLFPNLHRKVEYINTKSLEPSAGLVIGSEPEVDKPTEGVFFFGRDETLLALDRAFDTRSIVLLHAYAGSGKTATAAEFARWYKLTGGIEGPVLFSSFERKITLAQVLNETIEGTFSDWLKREINIDWITLTNTQRRKLALQVLTQIPVFWIWDNVEPIAGFPTGMPSTWNREEESELVEFLREAQFTKAKFLLTSRRYEKAWLGELAGRVKIPPMPMQERLQLTRAFAQKQGRRLNNVEDWLGLLRFAPFFQAYSRRVRADRGLPTQY